MKQIFYIIFFQTIFLATCFAQSDQEPLVIESFQCRGNNTTQCSFITDHLNLKVGEATSEEEIKNGKLRLGTLSNFTSVQVSLEKGSLDKQVKVIIEVVEADPLRKEFGAAISSSNDRLAQGISARIAHDNLFGTGKILDFSTKHASTLSGLPEKEFSAGLQYIDPNLFGNRKYYLIANAYYNKYSTQLADYDFTRNWKLEAEELSFGLNMGRRFAEYSYFSFGYEQSPISSFKYSKELDLGLDTTYPYNKEYSYPQKYLFLYGWNSENDSVFTTEGSRFQAGLAVYTQKDSSDLNATLGLGYRTTWMTADNSIWTIKLGNPGDYASRENLGSTFDDFFASTRWARDLNWVKGQRTRAYLEAGFARHLGDGQVFSLPGLKAGLLFETKNWGNIDLSVMAISEVGRR